MTKKSNIYGLAGILVIIMTIYFYSLVESKTFVDSFSFSVLIFSEIIFFGYVSFLSHKNSVFMNAGFISVLGIFMIVETILCKFRYSLFSENGSGITTVNIVLLVLLLSIIVAIYYFDSSEKKNDDFLLDKSEKKIQLHLQDDRYLEHKNLLRSLFEEIKYSNKESLSGYENSIYENVEKIDDLLLYKNDDVCEMLTELVRETITLVKKHKITVNK